MQSSSLVQTSMKGEFRYSQDPSIKMVPTIKGLKNSTTAELDELNEVIRILTKRQDNYLKLMEVFRKKKEPTRQQQSIQSYSLEHTHLYDSIKAQESQRVKEEISQINRFQGTKITDARQKMFVTRFCMRVFEIHEQGIMKLKSLQLFNNEMESQNHRFLQHIHRLLASETLDLEALLSVFMKHFTTKIQEELERIKICLVNCAMLIIDGNNDDDNNDTQIIGYGIQVGISQPLNIPTLIEEGKGNQEILGETVIQSFQQKGEIQLLVPSIKKKINSADMNQTMKQQQNCFLFYAKKFFNLYDALSLDKSYTSNQVSQLRLGNIDKHLYELVAKNSTIGESLKEYITTATLANQSRSAQVSPSSSPKRSLKNRQNYIQRLLCTSFFGSEVQTKDCISPRPKPRTEFQGTMTSFSLIPPNSSLYLSSPDTNQLQQPCQTSPDKVNPSSQHFGSQLVTQQQAQRIDSAQKQQFLPIRLFSAACHAPNADGKKQEGLRYYENTDGVSFYINKKPFVYVSPQFPVFKSSQYPGNAPQIENQANLTYVLSKNNCRQSPFQTARKIIMVKDIDTSNPRESYLLQTSLNQKAISPMREEQPQEQQQQVKPKGTIRLIKNPNKQLTTGLSQNFDNSKQKEQQRLATPNQTVQQLQLRMKILKQQKEKPAPFRNRSDNLQTKKSSQFPIIPDYYQAFSSQQYVSQSVVPQTPPRKISPGKQNKPEPQQEQIALKTNQTDNMSPQQNSPSKKKRNGITVSSISNEIKELNSSSQLGISSQNEVFQHIIGDNTQDSTIFSDNKLTGQLFIQNKTCYQSQNNYPQNSKKKLNPSGLSAKNDPLTHFYSTNPDNNVEGTKQLNISKQDQQELVLQKKPTNTSNLITSLDDMTYEQASRGRGHYQSVSSSFNVLNSNKILPSKSYTKACDQMHQQTTSEGNPVDLDQYKLNKQTLKNVQQVQQSKQQWQHRSFSNSGKDEKEDIGILNSTFGQNIFPLRSSSKNILQRTGFNQSSSKRQKLLQQQQQNLVKIENYYQGSPEENISKADYLNSSFSNNLDKQQQQIHSYQQQQYIQQIGEQLGSSVGLRKNNFMFQAAGRKINVNLPKILKQSNKNIHRSQVGQSQGQNDTSVQI